MEEIANSFWQAEARSQENKKFIKDIRRLAWHKLTAEEQIRTGP